MCAQRFDSQGSHARRKMIKVREGVHVALEVRALIGAAGALLLFPLTDLLFLRAVNSRPRRRHVVALLIGNVLAGCAVATWPLHLIPAGLLVAILGVPASVIDAIEHRIPDRLSIPLTVGAVAALAAAAGLGSPLSTCGRSLAAGVAWGGLLLVSFLISGQPGPGDVKLAPSLGIVLGWFGWSWLIAGIALAYLFAGLISLYLVVTKRLSLREGHVPMGPAMVAATLAVATAAALTQSN